MKRNILFTILATGLLLAASNVSAQTITVDFEADDQGNALAEGDFAGDAFLDMGVAFYFVNSNFSPLIATEGAPGLAYIYTRNNRTYSDVATSGVNTITDGSRQEELGAAFSEAVSEVSFNLIDFGDCISGGIGFGQPVTIRLNAFDTNGNVVGTDTYTINRYRGGSSLDGHVKTMSVSADAIAYVETSGLRQDCGWAIDDFTFTIADSDGDGVPNDQDLCPGTASSDLEAGVPSRGALGTNRWADLDGDGVFENGAIPGKGKGPGFSFTIQDTAGCNCAQIIEALDLGNGHTMHGCSNSAMQDWTALVNQ